MITQTAPQSSGWKRDPFATKNIASSIQDAKIREQIAMPKDYRIVAPVVVGYPKNVPGKPDGREAKILKVIF